MIRSILALLLLGLPAAAPAADRTFAVGSFDKVRVEGPYDVRVATGTAPRATVTGSQAAIDDLEIRLDGTTLVVRHGTGGWGEQPRAAANAVPMVVTLGTPGLAFASVTAGGKLTIGRMRAQRVDVVIGGAGTIAVDGVDTNQLNATVVGAGSMTLAGRAGRARIAGSGPATIDAAALDVHDLIVRSDGTGAIKTAARYTADVTNTGLGSIDVAGNAKCVIRKPVAGPVTCGAGAP